MTLPSVSPSAKPTAVPSIEPTKTPTLSPSRDPSKRPTTIPTSQPSVHPSNRPTTPLPSKLPTSDPTPSQTSYCGCSTCTGTVWNTPVTDFAGTFSCGQRIIFLQTPEGGSKSEYDSCKQIAEEFPSGQCGPVCNPMLCDSPVLELEDPDPSK